MRIVCQQLAPKVGEDAANMASIEGAIDEAVALGAELIVLPELCTSGYVFESEAEVAAAALGLDSSVFTQWQERLAGTGAVLIAGFPLKDVHGICNAAVMLDETGVLAVYRKVHLWDEEKRWFVPGNDAPPVVETRHGRVGVLVCYDLEFPEMVRGLLLQGVEIVAVPTNWPLGIKPDHERPAEIHDAMSSARLSRVIVACCDRSGSERGVAFTGGSAIIGADGWIKAERTGRDAGVLAADIDITTARNKVTSARNNTLDDRRPDVYAQMNLGR
jgi:predicted amidohydrolase